MYVYITHTYNIYNIYIIYKVASEEILFENFCSCCLF